MENPKVSIITTTYNDKENLKKIIAQVKNQDYANIEYVIVDGGSADGTLEVIAEAAEYFGDRLKWISEKDKGIYDAINKGIRLSTGDILGCCFDQYAGPDVISKMVAIMEKRVQTAYTAISIIWRETRWCATGTRARAISALAGCRAIRPCTCGKASMINMAFIRRITGFRRIMSL